MFAKLSGPLTLYKRITTDGVVEWLGDAMPDAAPPPRAGEGEADPGVDAGGVPYEI
jgi:hypothetical protein